MTPLGQKVKHVKAAQDETRAEYMQLMKQAAQELADKLSELFDEAVTSDEISDESELAKTVALKQPSMACVIDCHGAELRVDFQRYKDGALKHIDDRMRKLFLDMVVRSLTEKYPEYRIRRVEGVIEVTEPSPPKPLLERIRTFLTPGISRWDRY